MPESSLTQQNENGIPQRRGVSGIDGALALIVILLIVQMWWLTASLEAYLSGHHDSAFPAAIVSGIRRVDREGRKRR
jgi:Family of unknown function (DUF6755)